MNQTRTVGLGMVALASAAAFGVLAAAVSGRKTSYHDGRARRKFPKRRRRSTKAAATVLGYLGKPSGHVPASLLVAGYIWRQRGHAGLPGAAAVLGASASAAAASKLFDRVIFHRAPPPGRHAPSEPSFPSGHALETALVSLVMAYVVSREGLARPGVLLPGAIAMPLISAAGRLYMERHWLSDATGGLLAGVSLGAIVAAAYESAR